MSVPAADRRPGRRWEAPDVSYHGSRLSLPSSLVAVLELFRGARGASLSTLCPGRGRGGPCPLEKHSRCSHRLSGRGIGMGRRRWLVATVLVGVALIAGGCQRPPAQQPAAPAKPASQVPDLGGQTVRVGTDATYSPCRMLDKDKKIVGYDIDLIKDICQLANCKL